MACQLASNFSCYPKGVVWLLDHPKLVGKIGMHMWATYDIFYRCLTQYQELQVPYVKHLIFTDIEVIKDLSAYKPLPLSVADLCIFVILCCLCNVCAAHPEDEPMWRVEPCLLAVVREGLFTHMGTVIYGVILNDNRYYEDLNVEKFISFLFVVLFPAHDTATGHRAVELFTDAQKRLPPFLREGQLLQIQECDRLSADTRLSL